MRRSVQTSVMLSALLACSVSDRTQGQSGTTRALSEFDPALYRIIPIADLDDEPIFVERDGQRVELAGVVEAEVIVIGRDGGEPIEPLPAADLDFTAETETAAFCSCRYDRDYAVPHLQWVYTCNSGPSGQVCIGHKEIVYHWVTCTSTCTSCQLYTCTDNDTGTVSQTTPQPQYLVDTHPHECWDGTCP